MRKETYNFLKELQKKLKEQDIDGQASPGFWVIYDYKGIPTCKDFTDRTVLHVPEYCRSYRIENVYSLVEELNEEDSFLDEDELKNIKNKIDSKDLEGLLEWFQDHVDENSRIVNIWEEGFVVPNTMFITKEDAYNHLKDNHYHYTKKAHIYAMTAHRSPTVKKLWNILEQTGW